MKLSDEQTDALIAAAEAARENAYAPYSEFQVGAALLAADGRVFAGANVENSSYGLTICAERAAIGAAVAAGARGFTAIAVVTAGGHAPCGACRQVLNEWGGEMVVVMVDAEEKVPTSQTTLAELLPNAFRF